MPDLQQQKKQAGSESEGENSPTHLSRSCSVSVVVPGTQSYGPGIKRSTRASCARCTGKRQGRAKFSRDVDSDDPDDSDYTDGNDSGVSDIAASPHPTKRQRRIGAMKIQPARVRHKSPHPVFSPPTQPKEIFANPCFDPSLEDIETIPVRGFLTRQPFLSRVVYSCAFEEDRHFLVRMGQQKLPRTTRT